MFVRDRTDGGGSSGTRATVRRRRGPAGWFSDMAGACRVTRADLGDPVGIRRSVSGRCVMTWACWAAALSASRHTGGGATGVGRPAGVRARRRGVRARGSTPRQLTVHLEPSRRPTPTPCGGYWRGVSRPDWPTRARSASNSHAPDSPQPRRPAARTARCRPNPLSCCRRPDQPGSCAARAHRVIGAGVLEESVVTSRRGFSPRRARPWWPWPRSW